MWCWKCSFGHFCTLRTFFSLRQQAEQRNRFVFGIIDIFGWWLWQKWLVKSKNGALIPFRMGESWQNAVFLETKSKKQGYFGFRLPDHPAGSQRCWKCKNGPICTFSHQNRGPPSLLPSIHKNALLCGRERCATHSIHKIATFYGWKLTSATPKL